MIKFHKSATIATMLAATMLGGCATKSFVREQVAAAQKESKDDHQASLDALSAAASKQAGVDQGQDGLIATATQTSNEALERAKAAGKLAEGKFNYEVVMSDASVKFGNDATKLSPDAKQALTNLATKLKTDNRNLYLEIQGYTDSHGSDAYNLKLGEARAMAVYRFLHDQGIALNRMSVISYGEEHPVATNKTRAGRSTNRRVAIVVLS